MTEQLNEQTVDGRVYTLVRPILFDGQEVTSLTLDFEGLTGEDLITCSRQAKTMAPLDMSPVLALHLPYQITVTAKAAGVPAEMIQALKAKDFTQVTQRTANFLMVQE